MESSKHTSQSRRRGDGRAGSECSHPLDDGSRLKEALERRLAETTAELAEANCRLEAEIAERTRTAESLQEVTDRLREFESIINRGPAIVFRWRVAPGRWPVEFVSDNVRQLGYEPADLLSGRVNWVAITHPDDVPRLEAEVADYLRRGVNQFNQEYRLLAADGSIRWMQDHTVAITDAEGRLTHLEGIVLDITQRKQAIDEVRRHQKRLRSLASELILAEERERHGLAADLHDALGQMVTVARIKLVQAASISDRADLQPVLDELRDLADDAQQQIRSLTFQLSPPILYDLGLGPALEWLADDFHNRHGLEVAIDQPAALPKLDQQIEVILFRCVRELLMNVVKHARTHEARVRIENGGNLLRVCVEDDGCGFEPAAEPDPAKRPFGLFSICERLAHLGGRMHVSSSPDRGTTIVLELPHCQQAEANR